MSARSPASRKREELSPAPPSPTGGLLGEQPEQLLAEDATGLVVRLAGAPGPGAGLGDRVPVEDDPLLLHDELDRGPRQLLPVAHRRGDHRRHVGAALQLGRRRGLGASRVQAGEQLGDGAEHDAGLPQRGQDLADVAQERRVRPDDEYAAPGEPVTVGVEQVGRAVQRHRRLPGAGPALHDQHPGRLRPDDPVLLALDGGDDVAHPPGTGRGHRRQQRGLAGEPRARAGPLRLGHLGQVERLVVDRDDLPQPGSQVPAPPHPLGVRGGGGVERPGGGCPPVHQQGLVLVVLVEQADAADVADLAVVGVEPAEGQPVLGGTQTGEPVGEHLRGGVALGDGLRGADGLLAQRVGQPACGVATAVLELFVEHGHVGLFVGETVVVGGRRGRTLASGEPGGRAVRHRLFTFTGSGNGDCPSYQRCGGAVRGRLGRRPRAVGTGRLLLPRRRVGLSVPSSEPSRDSEYAHLAPLFEQFAALPPDHPDRAALRARLVTGHLPVVRHIARRFSGRGEPVEDLEQVGTIGLINALDRFDPGQGTPFLAYAVPTITGEIRRYFRDRTWSMRVPRRLKDIQSRRSTGAVGPLSQELASRHGRAPRVSELAARLDMPVDEVLEGLDAQQAYRNTSLDELVAGGETPLTDTLGTADVELDKVEYRETLQPLLDELPPRERTILVLRFFGNMTQTQIADRVGVSQMHVSRLLAQTLRQLREKLNAAE
jgi:RNA polymerase sigma-B factor